MKSPIPFTRFIRPNGRQEHTQIEVEQDEFQKWKELSDLGFRMTVELLPNQVVNLCIEHPTYGDFDMELPSNGPDVPLSLRTLLLRFDVKDAGVWLALQKGKK